MKCSRRPEILGTLSFLAQSCVKVVVTMLFDFDFRQLAGHFCLDYYIGFLTGLPAARDFLSSYCNHNDLYKIKD